MAILPGTLTVLVIAAAKLASKVRTAMANRRAARELLDWDNRALKDIGLSRSDVRGALALPLATDPTMALSLIAAGGAARARRADPADRTVPAVRRDATGSSGILPSAGPVLCT